MAKNKTCPRCRSGAQSTSAPDGRPLWQCTNAACGHTWTEGKKPGQGRKDWPTYQPKSRQS